MKFYLFVVIILGLLLTACQQESLTGSWVSDNGSRVKFEGASRVRFESGSRKERFYYRIVQNGGLNEGYTFWLELADLNSSRVKTVVFKNIDNYSSIKIDDTCYWPSR